MAMKKIRIKICNSDLTNKFSFGSFFLGILKKYYEVELSENPEYVIYNESDFEYLKYNCIRILITGENITPNFNLCDYGMGFDYLTFGDRFYRIPLYLLAQYYTDAEIKLADSFLDSSKPRQLKDAQGWELNGPDFTRQKLFTKADLAKKTGFCSFVYSNYLADPERDEMFNKLSTYKRVDAGGACLNNVGGRVKSKMAFESSHKFSIAFENSSRSGYVTERLVNAMVAGTIPIYWGSPDVDKEFNQNRFINCHAYKNFDEVVARIKEIDQNDELYLQIINEPIAAPGVDFQAIRDGFEKFLQHIFDQPVKDAKRRTINAARAAVMEANEVLAAKRATRKNFFRKLLAFFYKPFRRSIVIERLKQKILSKQIQKK